jgi:5-methylcytosine-specific restriction endonuclease McrA
MEHRLYDNQDWLDARELALARDGHRCSVARLLGGVCSRGPLHVHHLLPPREGGDPYDLDNLGTTCSRHHPVWEALRRSVVRIRRRDLHEDVLRLARLRALVRNTGHAYEPDDLEAELVRLGATADELPGFLEDAARLRNDPVAA